jgi:hypothetical protein
MRAIGRVMQALLDTVPDRDASKPALQKAFAGIARSAVYTSPEDLPRLWLRVRAALVRYYPATHPQHTLLARVFAGQPEKK